jgi:hypothetical protein
MLLLFGAALSLALGAFVAPPTNLPVDADFPPSLKGLWSDESMHGENLGASPEMLRKRQATPRQIDWTSFGKISKVRHQGTASTCWMHAALSAAEANHNLMKLKLNPGGVTDPFYIDFDNALHCMQLRLEQSGATPARLQHPADLVWYAHSKGQRNEVCWDSTPRNCSDHWRRYMTHFVVTNGWKNCGIPLSADEADTCGANWNDAAPRHYQGNFWWSTCAFINGNELPMSMAAVNISQPIENHRMSTEMWLWSARGDWPTFGAHGRPHGRPLCLHHASSSDNCTNHNLYMSPYLPSNYQNAALGKCCKVTLK